MGAGGILACAIVGASSYPLAVLFLAAVLLSAVVAACVARNEGRIQRRRPVLQEVYSDMIPGRVSIIMPCYNAAKYVDEAIQSLRAQTYSNFEILAVDDGSTDDTASTWNETPPTIPRVRVFAKKRRPFCREEHGNAADPG